MTLISKLRQWVSGSPGDYRDEIASLLVAAREDVEFRKRVLLLLRIPTEHRTSLVNTALHEMELRGEPKQLRAAFAILATDEGAKAALRALDAS